MMQREILKTAILAATVGFTTSVLAADPSNTAAFHDGEPTAWNIGGASRMKPCI